MPVGCEFICKNSSCENFNKGFSITGPWPEARIEMVITALSKIKGKESYVEELISRKNQGRKYACLVYPNYGEVEPVGWRVQMWNPSKHRLEDYDIIADEDHSIEQLIEKNVPKYCQETNCWLKSFNEVVNEGINCPICKTKLYQSRWFTNED